jgi:hypothetical protein
MAQDDGSGTAEPAVTAKLPRAKFGSFRSARIIESKVGPLKPIVPSGKEVTTVPVAEDEPTSVPPRPPLNAVRSKGPPPSVAKLPLKLVNGTLKTMFSASPV